MASVVGAGAEGAVHLSSLQHGSGHVQVVDGGDIWDPTWLPRVWATKDPHLSAIGRMVIVIRPGLELEAHVVAAGPYKLVAHHDLVHILIGEVPGDRAGCDVVQETVVSSDTDRGAAVVEDVVLESGPPERAVPTGEDVIGDDDRAEGVPGIVEEDVPADDIVGDRDQSDGLGGSLVLFIDRTGEVALFDGDVRLAERTIEGQWVSIKKAAHHRYILHCLENEPTS